MAHSTRRHPGNAMSALPPKADIVERVGMSALCQKQTKCSAAILELLLDHLVGERQKIHRQLDTRGLCGLEVDELVVCRLLERQATADAKFRQSGRGQPPFLGR